VAKHLAVSVVIPCGGHPLYQPRLIRCLESLQKQTVQPYRVYVIYMLEGEMVVQPQLELPLQPEVLFTAYRGLYPPSLARNVGLSRARGDILVTLDADSLIPPDTIRTCRWEIEQSDNQAFVRVRTSQFGFPTGKATPFRKAVEKDQYAPGPGGCIAAPRKNVRRIRGWDEQFVGYGAADWDYVTRLKKSGLHEVVLPKSDGKKIVVLHQSHKYNRSVELAARARNRKIYEHTLERENPVRNDVSWGRS